MKKEILSAILLSFACMILFGIIYTGIVWSIGKLTPGKGQAERIWNADGSIMYTNIAQKFTDDRYFWSRPSAVAYNASGSAGSNKGPANPEYLLIVQGRIDTFMAHNPGVRKGEIPADIVTASGSGLDPHISIQGAMIQAARIARMRGLDENKVKQLVIKQMERPLAGVWGPEKVNVLRLNLALDNLR